MWIDALLLILRRRLRDISNLALRLRKCMALLLGMDEVVGLLRVRRRGSLPLRNEVSSDVLARQRVDLRLLLWRSYMAIDCLRPWGAWCCWRAQILQGLSRVLRDCATTRTSSWCNQVVLLLRILSLQLRCRLMLERYRRLAVVCGWRELLWLDLILVILRLLLLR